LENFSNKMGTLLKIFWFQKMGKSPKWGKLPKIQNGKFNPGKSNSFGGDNFW